MKKIISELDTVTILLIITTIVACIKNNSYHIALISISILIYKSVQSYLNIAQSEQLDNNKLEQLNRKISDINEKVMHLTSKDTIKEVMSGLSNKR